MRISDWSSDVCSSDLQIRRLSPPRADGAIAVRHFLRSMEAVTSALGEKIIHRAIDRVGRLPRHEMPAARNLDDRHAGDEVVHAVEVARRQRDIVERPDHQRRDGARSEEHTSELQSLMRNSYAVFCL